MEKILAIITYITEPGRRKGVAVICAILTVAILVATVVVLVHLSSVPCQDFDWTTLKPGEHYSEKKPRMKRFIPHHDMSDSLMLIITRSFAIPQTDEQYEDMKIRLRNLENFSRLHMSSVKNARKHFRKQLQDPEHRLPRIQGIINYAYGHTDNTFHHYDHDVVLSINDLNEDSANPSRNTPDNNEFKEDEQVHADEAALPDPWPDVTRPWPVIEHWPETPPLPEEPDSLNTTPPDTPPLLHGRAVMPIHDYDVDENMRFSREDIDIDSDDDTSSQVSSDTEETPGLPPRMSEPLRFRSISAEERDMYQLAQPETRNGGRKILSLKVGTLMLVNPEKVPNENFADTFINKVKRVVEDMGRGLIKAMRFVFSGIFGIALPDTAFWNYGKR